MSTLPNEAAGLLRWRPSGPMRLAYAGTVRVGYVEQRWTNRWLWQLSLIPAYDAPRPIGYENDEQSAKDSLAAALAFWIDSAGLRL